MEIKFPIPNKKSGQRELQDYLDTLQVSYDANLFTRKEDTDQELLIIGNNIDKVKDNI